MKKLLLACAAFAAFSMSAADITESFKTLKDWGGFPAKTADAVAEVKTITSPETDIEYTYFSAAGSTYLMLINKSADQLGYIQFALPIDCAMMAIHTTSGCSEKDGNAINVYANDELILENVKINVKSADITLMIPAANQAAGTIYKIQGTTKSVNNQIESIVYKEPSTEASLIINEAAVTFAAVKDGEQTKNITGIANNIDGNITITCDNAAFEVAASCTASELAAGVPVTFKPAAAGEATATLTFTVGDLTATSELSAYAAAHEGTEADPLTVEDVLGMNNGNEGPFFVTGTVMGVAANINEGNPAGYVEPNDTASNIAIGQEGVEKTLAVELPTGATREALNLVDNPDMLGQDIIISGKLIAYFGRPGVKSTKYVGLSGVEGVSIDANAPAEYYNLQGVRVAQPANGLYIVRQGGKTSKVLVK